ncbi:MAG: hypothetical protein C5B53_09955 [Candidatus Melainabacteria bacterium]|nr:MAG: hypothetical protein C5B53_09955 [Candidatus Melainabacteria bacterium]
MVIDQAQAQTQSPSKAVHQENILVLPYSEDLIEQLARHVDKKHLYDAVLIDASTCGFFFTAECLLEAARLGKQILELQGTMVFLKADKAVGISRDSLMGNLSLLTFENYAELFDYSPVLARHVQVALGHSGNSVEESTDLFHQVLMSTIPVLTRDGIRLKATIDSISRRNSILALIDNFTPLSTITERLVVEQGRMTTQEMLEELKGLESSKAIYPVLPKIPFLVHCFKNKTPFSLRDYLIAAKFVSQAQLDEMLLELQHNLSKEHLSLGPLALKKGHINGRQLEITLQDQAFYGQGSSKEQVKLVKTSGEESQVHSLIGRLGTTDPSNLLQNLAQNRENGVLSVEYKDLQFRALFDMGKITHAKVGKVVGNDALIEFASAWREGVFVFIQRTPPPDLAKDACKLTKFLEKLLLDAALCKDNLETALKELPKGRDSILEKVPDDKRVLLQEKLLDPQDQTPLSQQDVNLMKRVWQELDGLSSLAAAIRKLADVTTYDGVRAAIRLLRYKLVSLPEMDLSVPLDKFRQLCKKVSERIGVERSLAFLRLSLRDTMSYSVRARMFALGASGEVGIDMAAARSTGASLSLVIQDIEDWQVKYIEYVSQELDSEILLGMIQAIHQQ